MTRTAVPSRTNDVFVHEVAGPACLPEEAVREARLEPRQDQLDRHLLAESYIECMEDDAHAPAAAETQDLVALAERGAYELEVGVPTLLGSCPPAATRLGGRHPRL